MECTGAGDVERALAVSALFWLLLGFGCDGSIADVVDPGGPGPSGSTVGSAPPQSVLSAVPLRRFNRVEYSNVMRTLLGVDDLGDSFPLDGSTRGFDVVAYSLTTDDSHARAHLANVERAVPLALSGPMRDSIVTCADETEACLRQVWGSFASRAWRRPPDPSELDELVSRVFEPLRLAAFPHELILASGIQALLMAPEFFFRLEVASEPRPLTSYEMALRLSMFLWSDLPDASLRQLADENRLVDDDTLRAEVRRMLAEPRADGWIRNFAGQLLGMRALPTHEVSADLYPEFTAAVRASAIRESEAIFRELLGSRRAIGELVSSRWTLLDTTLADYYGVPRPGGEFTELTELPPNRAFGFLGRVGFLTWSSLSERTSVVRRGNAVLSKLLCVELVLPDNVAATLESDAGELSLRQKLERHRADPACAACHDHIDPLGFAFEHFDAVGRWRDVYEDNGQPVDDSGVLLGYGAFDDGMTIAPVLAADPRFHQCMAQQLAMYAIGNDSGPDDGPWLTEISRRAMEADHSFGDLIEEVVLSRPFRNTGVGG